MTFNSLTLEACCDKCKTTWRSRTGNIPKKCHKCGSATWNDGTRKFTSIIARIGIEDHKTGMRELCFIDFIDSPMITSEDIFYVSKKDIETYFAGRSPPGSGIVILGRFFIGEDKLLKINEMKLVLCFEATFRSYVSTVSCLYNIKSFYQKQEALKKYEEDKLLKEQQENKRKEEAIKAAKERLNAARARDLKILEAERMLEDDTVSNTDKMAAIALLRK